MHILKNLAATLKNGFQTFMPTCQQVGRLQSAGLDQPQSFSKRLGLRLHLLVCKWCQRYGRQICFLQEAARQHSDELIPFPNENRWMKRQSLTRPSATLAPSDGERDGVRGVRRFHRLSCGIGMTQATPASLSSEARERLRRSLRDESG